MKEEKKELVDTQDTTDRFRDDDRLRRFGFTILSRRKNEPARWDLCGVEYTEEEAHKQVDEMMASVHTYDPSKGKKK